MYTPEATAEIIRLRQERHQILRDNEPDWVNRRRLQRVNDRLFILTKNHIYR